MQNVTNHTSLIVQVREHLFNQTKKELFENLKIKQSDVYDSEIERSVEISIQNMEFEELLKIAESHSTIEKLSFRGEIFAIDNLKEKELVEIALQVERVVLENPKTVEDYVLAYKFDGEILLKFFTIESVNILCQQHGITPKELMEGYVFTSEII
jgi:hypothetical protein